MGKRLATVVLVIAGSLLVAWLFVGPDRGGSAMPDDKALDEPRRAEASAVSEDTAERRRARPAPMRASGTPPDDDATLGDAATAAEADSRAQEPLIEVRIRAVHPDGRPAVGATVHLVRRRNGGSLTTVVTDGTGLAVHRTTPYLQQRLHARAELAASASPRVRLRDHDDATGPALLELGPAITLRGTVVGAAGEMIEGARITAYAYDELGELTDMFAARTDADGEFAFDPVPHASVHRLTLHAMSPGHAQLTRTVRDIAPGVLQLPLRLEPGHAFHVRCVTRQGSPCPDVVVMAYRTDESVAMLGDTGTDGTLETTDLAGETTLLALIPDSSGAPRHLRVRPNTDIDLGDVVIEPGAPVTGVVSCPDRSTAERTRVWMVYPEHWLTVRSATTELGDDPPWEVAYRTEDVGPEPLLLRVDVAQPTEFQLGTHARATVFAGSARGGDERDVVLEAPTELRLRVVNEETGRPLVVRRGWVFVDRDDGSRCASAALHYNEARDEIRLHVFGAGRVRVSAQLAGHADARVEGILCRPGRVTEANLATRPEKSR